jgi:CHAT domain-containing protein
MKIRFLDIAISSLALSILGTSSTIASTPLSDCSNLTKELAIPINICDGLVPESYAENLKKIKINNISKLNELGITLRKLGYLEQAKLTLNGALELSEGNIEIKLSLANVEKQIFRRMLNSYTGTTSRRDQLKNDNRILNQASLTLNQYENLFGNLETTIQIKAALNWLSVWSSLEIQTSGLEEIQKSKLNAASELISKIDSRINSFQGSERFADRLSFGESLWKARNKLPSTKGMAQANIITAIKEAEATNNLPSISSANGLYGKILFEQGNIQKALTALNIAINSAKSVGAINEAQKWETEIARIYAKTGNQTKASIYYEASISDIEQIQKNILPLKNELQFAFRDQIEPTYREYLELLFKSKQPDLNKILDVFERIQVGEIENYLQCSDLGLVSRIRDLPSEESPDAAIYLIQMPHQYAVILRDKNRKLNYRLLNYNQVDESIRSIRQNLQGKSFKLINNRSMKIIFHDLYNAVLGPVENILPKEGNLVWVVDSKLQSIPWGLLSDGDQYLLEKYLISYSLGVELEISKSLNLKNLTALIAGSTIFPNEPKYSSLPSVSQEIETVKNFFPGKNLLDENFTYNHLISHTGFSIIHIASHAQYSSNPDESFILSWENRIKMQDLQKLVEANKRPLELLILSACESAEGDSRAPLGLAGTAVRSGARSTVASLWLVRDVSQVKLMGQFYQGLKHGMSRAQALQQAQITLLKSDEWSNPYYWANMILLGSYR